MKIILDEGAKMPTRAHADDAGLGLYSRENRVIYPHSSATFDTGVHVEIPQWYVGMIKSKSGLNAKYGLTSEGVLDCGYYDSY